MVASAVPSPAVKVRPFSPDRVKAPLVTVSVTVSVPLSISATEIAFPAPAEKTIVPSSAIVCGPGTVLTGASLTGVTLTVTVAVSVTPPDVTV